jgi:Fe-S-cluster-containing dehydrogenase component
MNSKYGSLIPTGRLIDGKPRSILFDATKCIGCRQCVPCLQGLERPPANERLRNVEYQLDHHAATRAGGSVAHLGKEQLHAL